MGGTIVSGLRRDVTAQLREPTESVANRVGERAEGQAGAYGSSVVDAVEALVPGTGEPEGQLAERLDAIEKELLGHPGEAGITPAHLTAGLQELSQSQEIGKGFGAAGIEETRAALLDRTEDPAGQIAGV